MAHSIGEARLDDWIFRNRETISNGLGITGLVLLIMTMGAVTSACVITKYETLLSSTIFFQVLGGSFSLTAMTAAYALKSKKPVNAKNAESITPLKAAIDIEEKKLRMITLFFALVFISYGAGLLLSSFYYSTRLNLIGEGQTKLSLLYTSGVLSTFLGIASSALGCGFFCLKNNKYAYLQKTIFNADQVANSHLN